MFKLHKEWPITEIQSVGKQQNTYYVIHFTQSTQVGIHQSKKANLINTSVCVLSSANEHSSTIMLYPRIRVLKDIAKHAAHFNALSDKLCLECTSLTDQDRSGVRDVYNTKRTAQPSTPSRRLTAP